MKEPQTPAEWQEAVDLAEFNLHLDSARRYGLVSGGPGVDVGRCEQLLRDGRRRRVRPSPGCVERITAQYLAAAAAEARAGR